MPSETTALRTVTILPSREDTSACPLPHEQKPQTAHPDTVSLVFLYDVQKDKAVESVALTVYSQCTVFWFSVPWVNSRLPAACSVLARNNPKEKHFLCSSLESSPQHELLTMRLTTRRSSSYNPMPLKTPGNN